MLIRNLIIISVLYFCTNSLYGQATPPDDPLMAYLFPPEKIMENQKIIQLSDTQRKEIIKEITTAQMIFQELHWDLREKMDGFESLLSQPNIDEEAAIMQLGHVLDQEAKIKKGQMTLMIRLKNHLTQVQQTKLREIKSEGKLP